MAKTYLTVEETAERLAVAPKTIRKWCREEKLPCVKLGRLWRIREDELGELEGFLGK